MSACLIPGSTQIALRVALLTGADVCGIEMSEYCTEFAQSWRDAVGMKPLFNDFHCEPGSGSKVQLMHWALAHLLLCRSHCFAALIAVFLQIVFLAEDFLQERLRDQYERATCMFINNFVFTHQTNAALSERILEWCAGLLVC